MSESLKPATRERELEPGAVKRFEYEKWSRYFGEALSGQGQEHERNLWWEVSDTDTIEIVASLFERDRPIRILEAGCGSGGTNFHLAEHMNVASIHLLDLTETALCFARELEPPALAGRVHYVRGDAFRLPFAAGSFDLTWNVGTIEHYPLPAILRMVGEMMRVTRRDGFVVAAIPNRYCLAVMKAWLLGTRCRAIATTARSSTATGRSRTPCAAGSGCRSASRSRAAACGPARPTPWCAGPASSSRERRCRS
jgi:SAM-dependent methyltransferase